LSNTPLTDFIVGLADPAMLERFRADPAATAAAAGLSEDLIILLISDHSGAIRVRAIQELEHAGLAPLLSDKFSPPGHGRDGTLTPALHSPITKSRGKADLAMNQTPTSRASIFPISTPSIPLSAFPIKSQEDLVNKISRLFLKPPFPASRRPASRRPEMLQLPAGQEPGNDSQKTVRERKRIERQKRGDA
jgi:hypothetical protein